MGCVCCKPSAIEDSKESPRERVSSKTSSDLRVARVTSSSREEAFRTKDQYDGNDARVTLIDKQVNGSGRLPGENFERKREKMEHMGAQHPSMGRIPKAAEETTSLQGGRRGWLQLLARQSEDGYPDELILLRNWIKYALFDELFFSFCYWPPPN